MLDTVIYTTQSLSVKDLLIEMLGVFPGESLQLSALQGLPMVTSFLGWPTSNKLYM